MPVFRVERTSGYTVMSNFHFKDKRLSLKAKGLLSQMLSLPEGWDYTLSGLCCINRESKDAIRSAIVELEKAGYVRRRQTVDENGKFSSNEYTIYEKPLTDLPPSGNPTTDSPPPEKPAQLNNHPFNTKKSNTDGAITQSFLIPPGAEPKRKEAMTPEETQGYRSLIREQIDYDALQVRYPAQRAELAEIFELLTETVCAGRKTTRISGSVFPHEAVRSRFLKLNSDHIEFVLDCLRRNTTEIRNVKQYLLAVLFNAPTTMNNHYMSQVNQGMLDCP